MADMAGMDGTDVGDVSSSKRVDEEYVESLIRVISSSALDSVQPHYRTELVQEATSVVLTHESARGILSSMGVQVASGCTSRHAYHRLCHLLTRALAVQCGGSGDEKDEESSSKSSLEDVPGGLAEALCHLLIRHATVHDYGPDEDATVTPAQQSGSLHPKRKKRQRKKKAKNLTRLAARDLGLLAQPRRSLRSLRKIRQMEEGGEREDDGDAAAVRDGLAKDQRSVIENVTVALLSVARATPTTSSAGRYAPALALVHHLQSNVALSSRMTTPVPQSTDGQSPLRSELLDLMVKRFFGSSSTPAKFATPAEIHCCASLLSSLTQEELDGKAGFDLAKTMGTKLRANPESAMGTVTEIVKVLGVHSMTVRAFASGGAGSVGLGSPGSCWVLEKHVEGDTKLLPSAMKQLKSPKGHMREGGITLLVNLVAIDPLTATLPVVTVVSEGLQGKGTAALTSPDQREGAYRVLRGVAYRLVATSNHGIDGQDMSSICSAALEALATAVGKESSDGSAKQVGCDSIATWLGFALRLAEDGESRLTKSKGFAAAISFLSAPLISKAVAKEFRFRVGSTYLNPFISTEASVKRTLTWHLFDSSGGKFEQGLKTMVENAAKKHGGGATTASSIVPQLDGVLASYLLVLHGTSDLVGNSSVPANVVKAIQSPTSFLYCPSIVEHCVDPMAEFVPRCVELFVVRGNMKTHVETVFRNKDGGAARGLAAAAIHPRNLSIRSATRSCLRAILEGADSSSSAVVTNEVLQTMFDEVNRRSVGFDEAKRLHQAQKEAREAVHPINEDPVAGRDPMRRYDDPSVRDVAGLLVRTSAHYGVSTEALIKGLILSHVGGTRSMGRPQRHALAKHTKVLLRQIVKSSSNGSSDGSHLDPAQVSAFLASCACNGDESSGSAANTRKGEKEKTEETNGGEKWLGGRGSSAIHGATCSLIVSLGHFVGSAQEEMLGDGEDDGEEKVGDDVNSEATALDVATSIVQNECPRLLAERLSACVVSVAELDENDLAMFRSREGELFEKASGVNGSAAEAKSGNAAKKRPAKTRKGKGDFGAGFQDEEWERQIKTELAAKKKQAESSDRTPSRALTAEEKVTLAEQTKKRSKWKKLLADEYPRSLRAISSLCNSDIIVGNECLPALGSSVVHAVTQKCPAKDALPSLSVMSFETLCTLASCVYEIDEAHASDLSRALSICQRGLGVSAAPTKAASELPEERRGETRTAAEKTTAPLPALCPPASTVLSEIDDYGDALSGASFVFVFPLLKAALTGPRTVPGCEGVLAILAREIPLLEEEDPLVCSLRRDMALGILELLAHDRSQTFHDPTPYEALVSLYAANCPKPSASELAPLVGEKGALGGKNCRMASMMALETILSEHPSAARANPLVENRIWVNCFDADEAVRTAARSAWHVKTGTSGDDDNAPLAPPSKIYAVPLLSLVSNDDAGVAKSASDAFACAMGMHPDTAERGILRLCSAYIDAFPKVVEAKAPPKKVVSKPATKAALAKISAPKRTATKPIGAGIGTGQKKVVTRVVKKKVAKQPAAKKVMTKEQLESQFLPGASKKDEAEKDTPEKIQIRLGVLRTFASIADASSGVKLEITSLKLLVSFLMLYANADLNAMVCTAARNAAKDVIATNGASEEALAFLLPHIENVLSGGKIDDSSLEELNTDKVPKTVAASDRRKEGAVVALGSVALHLKGEGNATKIDSTIDMLIDTLQTPSEDVQASVAASLAKLMKKGRTKERVEVILNDLMKNCLHGTSFAMRRGSAYGVSAVVKGSGIACLKKYDVVKRLEDACQNGGPNSKEGALCAIELLCDRLGLLFEPYVIVLLPALLKCFSDSNDYVRSAASNTAGLIMSRLSAHGVKLVMPAVLSAFDEPEWRTKQASIHMLGSMSQCAPKQLASALPKVVPKLTEAFGDTHAKVKTSAEQALNEISKVIRNPEIAELSPVLVSALTDPSNETKRALEALIETEFLHAIDAPSLALIVPVLYRGLRDRGASAKRYSALIAGNMCTMISDPKDFSPYLPVLMPCLKTVLLDPIPDVRSTSAKALGSLTRGLGEDALPDLRPWLINTLKGELGSSVERSGAAQGLTEVLIAGGTGLVESVMIEEILPLKSHPKACTREGVLWVLTFLPSALGQAFAPLIDVSLPALLTGLSDDSEPVREVAMRAGRVLVKSHGKAHVDKILPSLECGLIEDDWRIRFASLSLLGDLLSNIGGTKVATGDADTQEDIRQAERAQAQIALVLGAEKRKRVLSRLYLARCDTAAVVRQIAVQVWKTVVSVTARTLRDILHVLVEQIVAYLASGNPEQTEVGGRCLGDVVTKLGDAVLPEIIPVLRDNLYRGDEHTRRGACVGLAEVISCSSKDHINKFLGIIVKAVQDALCDEDEGVRGMAAGCFQSLYNVVGSRTLDEVVPVLLAAMREGSYSDAKSKERALHGLTGILKIRSREIMPFLVPRLIQCPMTKSNANALGAISEVTGGTISLHFHSIISVLLSELASFTKEQGTCETDRESAIRTCTRRICANVDREGLATLVGEVANKCNSDKYTWRRESCWMFGVICEERNDEADFYEQVPVMLRELLYRLNDENKEVLVATHGALTSLTKHVPAEELVNHLEFCRNLLASIVSECRRRKGGVGDGEFLLPGFNMPKGLEPLLPIYQRGILYGNANLREVAAAGLGELIMITDKKYLAGPFIIKMTGPLLRIVGDRNPSPVKIAIIQTLGLILQKGGPALRAFVPQFQTTFVKALSDPSRQVRLEAAKALALLMPLSTRVDPLIKELVTGSLGNNVNPAVESGGAVAVQTATLGALATVLKYGGKKAKLQDTVPSAVSAGRDLLFDPDEGIREGAAKVLGAASSLLGPAAATELLRDTNSPLSELKQDSDEVKHGKAHLCFRVLSSSVGPELDDSVRSDATRVVKALVRDETSVVKEAACVAMGGVLGSAADPESTLSFLEGDILYCMDPSSQPLEVYQSLARGLCFAVRMQPTIFRGKSGLSVMDGALKLAMSGNQRVQLAFNDFLWLALAIEDGEEGLDDYVGVANFENTKGMKNLAAKVLSRMKPVEEEE